jgi:nuclease S1
LPHLPAVGTSGVPYRQRDGLGPGSWISPERFLVHLIEDLHMPMHVGENHDKGGNTLQVRFFDQGSNLHSVWDNGIITRAEPKEDRWVDLLAAMDTPEGRKAAMAGTFEDWATESILASREAYKDVATGLRMKSGAKLGDDYQAKSLPVAKERLYRASARLAMVLNEVLTEN